MRFSYKVVTYENTKIFDVNTKSVTCPFSLFKGKKTCSNNLRHKFTDICVSNRNQMGVYERTLHDCELNSPYLEQSFEITDHYLRCTVALDKALKKSLTLLFLQNKSPFR